MAFKKAKSTFLSAVGRNGAPSARKPFAKKNTKATAAAHAAGNGKSSVKVTKKVVKNGAPLKHGTPKQPKNVGNGDFGFSLGKGVDQRLKNYFMSKGPKLTSVTNSPQSAPQAFKPRG